MGGDGGFAEVSGKDSLVFSGSADLSAPAGSAGMLLVDPADLTIDGSMADSFDAILAGGSDLTATATNDVTVASPMTWNNGGSTGGSLTLSAGNELFVNSPITSLGRGNLTFKAGPDTIYLRADVTTAGGGLDYAEPVVLDLVDVTLTTHGGAVHFESTLSGAFALTVDASGDAPAFNWNFPGNGGNGGSITFGGAVNSSGNLSLTSNGGRGGDGGLSAGAGGAGGDITFSNTATLTGTAGGHGGVAYDNNAGSGGHGGNIAFGALNLGGALTLNTAGGVGGDASDVGNGGAGGYGGGVTFNGKATLTGADAMTLTTTGGNGGIGVNAGAGGNGGAVSFGAVDLGGALAVTSDGGRGGTWGAGVVVMSGSGGAGGAGGAITFGAANPDGDQGGAGGAGAAIHFGAAVTLTGTGAMNLTSDGGAGGDGTGNGAGGLGGAGGDIGFGGTVGSAGAMALHSRGGDGGAGRGAGGTGGQGGGITLSGAVDLGDAIALDSHGGAGGYSYYLSGAAGGGGGAVVLGGAIDSGGALALSSGGGAGGVSLFGPGPGSAGGVGAIGVNGGGVTTTGAQTYNNAVTLGASATLTGSALSVPGLNAQSNDLTLDIGAQVTVPSVFTNVANFTSEGAGGTLIAGDFSTSGTQSYNNAATLGADNIDLTTTKATFGGTLNSAASHAYALTVHGAAEFDDAVGGGVNLGALQVTGASTLKNAVTTDGTQTYGGAVTLGGGTPLTSGGHDITFSGTVDGGRTLTIAQGAGTLTFAGAVGHSTPLSSLSVTGAGTERLNGGEITTSGAQSYGGPALLGADTTLTGSALTLGSSFDAQSHDLTLGFSSAVTLPGVFSHVKNLTSSGSGGTRITGDFTTTGTQTYQNAVTLSGGARSLTATAVEFDAGVDGSADGSGLTVNGAATLNGASVNTGTGDQSYSGTVTVGVNTALTGKNLTLAGVAFPAARSLTLGTVTVGVNTALTGKNLTLAGVAFPAARSLTLTNNGGVATLNGTVNGVDTLTANGTGTGTSLAVNGLISGNWVDDREATTLAGGSVITSHDQSYSGTVTLGAPTTLAGTNLTLAGVGGASNDLTLTDHNNGVATLNGAVTNVGTLTANGDAGTSLAVNTTISAGSVIDQVTTTLAGASVNTGGGNQTYSGAVTLGHDEALTAGTVEFDGTVNGSAGNHGLTVTGATTLKGASVNTGSGNQTYNGAVTLGHDEALTAGTVDFDGTVDGSAGNHGLTVTGATTLNGASVNTGSGNQTYNGAVTLGHDEALTAGTVEFDGTVNGSVGNHGLTVTGATTLNGASVNTGNGNQTYNGAVTLAHAEALTAGTVEFDSTVNGSAGNHGLTVTGATKVYGASVNTGTGGQTYNGAFHFYQPEVLTGGNIDFQGTVNGDALTVHKGAGTVTFEGAVGGSGQLYSLTVDAGGHTVLQGGSVDTFTDQNYNGPVTLKSREQDLNGAHVNFGDTVGENASENNNLVVNGAAGLNGPSVDTGTGSQTYVYAVTLGHDVTLTSPSIEFLSTVDGGYGLTVNKGGGSLKFDAAVGGSGSGLASLTVDGGLGAAFLQGGSVRTSGDQTYGSVVLLQNADETLTGAHVIFGNDVHSASYGLTVNGATSLNGSVVNTGTGAQSYNGAVTLGNAQTLTGPAIDFKSMIDGNYALLVNKGAGTVTFEGAVGGSGSGLLVLIVDALGNTVLQGGSVRTSDFQTYSGPVTLKTRDQALTSGTQVTFGGTVGENASENNGLTVNGAANLNGASVNTGTGGQLYNGTVTLGHDEALTGGSIDFRHNVGGGYGLTVTKGAGTLTFEGAATPGSLTVDALGQTILQGGSVSTSGDQNYGGPVILKSQGQALTGAHVNFGGTVGENASENNSLFVVGPAGLGASVNTGGGDQSYNGAVTLSGNATLTGAALTLQAVTLGGHNLTLTNSGAASLNGAVSGVGALAANGGAGSTLVVNSTIGAASLSDDEVTTLNNGAVTTTGAQTYGKAVTLGHDATLDSSAGHGDITFSDTVEGAYALVVNAGTGHAAFGGPMGDVTPLGSLAVTAGGGINLNGDIDNGNGINTTGHGAYTGSQTYTGPVLLGADTTLTASKGTLASPTAADGAITFSGKVEAAANADGSGANYGLTTYSDGATTFSGKVGDSGAPRWVEAHITGSDPVNDVIKLNGGEVDTGQFQEYDGNAVIGENTTLNGGVMVWFKGTVDSPGHYDLTELGSIAAEFDGPVGVGSALGKLSVGAGDIHIDGGTVKTVNDQDYSGSYIDLGSASDAHFISTSGSIDFENIIGADTGLGLNVSAASDITFGKAVGFIHGMGPLPGPLGFLTAAASAIHINGGAVNTHSSSATGSDNGNQTYSGPVTLGADATLTSSGHDITLLGTVNGAAHGLTVNKGAGTATFGGIVGGGAGLGSLTVDALGATVLQGGAITTTGDQTYSGPVTLKTVNQALTGAHVNFGDTVGENASENNALTVNGLIGLNGASVNTGSGAQTYNGAVTLGANETFSGSGIDFKGTVNADSSARTLRVTDAGATAFEAAVGGANVHLSWLNVTSAGGTTLGGNVTTAGIQTYQSPVTLSGNATLTGTAVTLGAVTGGGHDLTLTNSGSATLNGAVSGVGALTANGAGGLTTYSTLSAASVSDSEVTALGGSVATTGGDQSYTDTVALTADTTLTAATIELAAVTGNTKNLTLTNSGAATLSGAVSGVGALRANGTGTLAVNNTISAASLNDAEATTLTGTGGAASVTTTGDQNYGGAVTLGANTTLTASTLELAAVTGAGHDLTLTNAGAAALGGAVSGVGALTANGAGTLATSAAISAASVADGEGTTLGAAVTTSGGQSYTNAVTLGANTTLTSSTLDLAAVNGGASHCDLTLANTGALTFNGAVSGVGVLTANSIDGTGALVGGGPVTWSAALGAASVNIYGTDLTMNGDITTTGAGGVRLYATGKFEDPASQITMTGAGRFLIYSADWSRDNLGPLTGSKQYNATYADWLLPAFAGNGFLFETPDPALSDYTGFWNNNVTHPWSPPSPLGFDGNQGSGGSGGGGGAGGSGGSSGGDRDDTEDN
ncbi:MAG: hypothetical protein NTX64_14240 [Elusimicrobia bacterium]|nr:hypothetical protein [Elusimicrobiota bacterium]